MIAAAATTAMFAAAPATAQDAPAAEPIVKLSASYSAEVIGVVDGGAARGARALDNLDITADVDLARAIGWRGASFHADVLNNFGGVTLRAGLYDLNSEFYVSDPAGLLVNPIFGIGSELSSTGPNGPSIFPSTALAARLRVERGRGYAQAAVINATAGTLGDDGGIDTSARNGVLVIAEAGITAPLRLGIGGWRYTKRQPGVIPPGVTPVEERFDAQGAYVLASFDLAGAEGDVAHTAVFARAGVSDGRTTPFSGGWQAGVLIDRLFAARPASMLSLGAGSGVLSRPYRDGAPAGSPPLTGAETLFELTYSDELLAGLSIQPDVQYILHPGADRSVKDAIVLALRFSYAWPAD
ncbi:carbohydrate porin [Sphingomonas sp.]|uniref:carbohydrate porin n=1 Tax=Sphingomonas sp. TaxID=28214 RepID=UPI0025805963|nr:carbohydrate porin [Sphingomonas sp.]